MHVTLMHNPRAGMGQPTREELMTMLRDEGYDVTYQSTKAKDFARALDNPGELVIVAGGDGTVSKVATRLVGRDVRLAILPLGTANNIASTLGVKGPLRQLVGALRAARLHALDIGEARAPWGTTRFLEAIGVGVFARMLASERDAEHAESGATEGEAAGLDGVTCGLRMLLQTLERYAPLHWHVTADEQDLSGHYLFVEVMSIRCIGPRLPLAPEADPGDGRLDLVVLREDERELFAEYLRSRLRGHDAPLRLRTLRARHVKLGWMHEHGHVDDEVWPDDGATLPSSAVSRPVVDVAPVGGAVQVLIPNTVEHR